MKYLLSFLLIAAFSSPCAFATGAGQLVPNGPFGPIYPQSPEDVRWLDAARAGERQLVGSLVYIDLRDRDGFYFRVATAEGWLKPSESSIEGILTSVSDQGSPFFYTLQTRNQETVTVVVGGAKSYAELQSLRWVK